MAGSMAWFSFAESAAYAGEEPYFFSVEGKDWKKLLEDNYEVLLDELQNLIDKKEPNIIPYFNQTLASAPSSWTIFPLLQWKKPFAENCQKVPRTVQIIGQIPNLTSCAFSILKPQTKIKPHFGDSNVMYRCHLTLKSKTGLPQMGIRVGKDERSWQEGKLFAFCDAWEHEVWNNTDEERWVLIVDVLREEFVPDGEKICRKVRATLWWQLKFQKHYFIKHIPQWGRRLMMNITALFV